MWRNKLVVVAVVYAAAAVLLCFLVATGAWREPWDGIKANVLF